MTSMRQYTGKHLVAFLRGKNYAHAGEEEAISIVLDEFPKKNDRVILDVGCGLGETANFIQKNGWGLVTGFDIEKESIDYAKKHYPDIAFFISDVNTIQNTIKTQFDISCLFNSFYSFHNQEQALYSLNLVTKTGGTLVIFDYLDLCTATKNPLIKNNCQLPFIPINLNTIEKMLLKTGWVLSKRKIVNDEYEKWYTNLVTTILANKEKIIEKFGKSIYDSAYCKYKLLLDATTNKTLGGIIVYAQKLK